jgi:IclR family acetate operon transcriptional repressor
MAWSLGSPVERCFELIELLADEANGLTLAAIGEQLGHPKSATHRFLNQLVQLGYLAKDDGTRTYRLTLRLPAIGFRFLAASRIYDVCQPTLDRLAAATGEYVSLGVVNGKDLVWVACARVSHWSLNYEPTRGPYALLHATASGIAWLATLPEEDAVRIVLEHGFEPPPNYGLKAVRTVPELICKLDQTRRQGYGLALEEGEPGIHAISVAFSEGKAPDAPAVGAITVVGPASRLPRDRLESFLPDLRAAAAAMHELWPMRRISALRTPSKRHTGKGEAA